MCTIGIKEYNQQLLKALRKKITFLDVLFYLAEMKQRSASLDQPAYSHRRHLQYRTTVTIRAPGSNDESLLPSPIIDLNKTNIKQYTKLVCI
ncbi:unnamed protein product [Adineta steineri]|uniref:Uncharacterized protein n=1 Tax=Adineta steineri TaxID=433720 RepID=A0A819Y9J0_9BILA|nr:unnamed protein product [Adineta steineri]